MINKIRFILSKRDKQFLVGLLFLSVFVALIETVGVSAIMPFIAVSSNFDLIHSNEYYQFLFEFFNFSNEISFVITFGILLVIFYIFRAGINLLYFFLLAKFSQGRYHLLAFKLYQKYLLLPYKDFVNKNSSFLTKSIINEANTTMIVISQFLLLTSEIFVVIFIYSILLFVNWKITLLVTTLLLLKILFLTKVISGRVKKYGVDRASFQKELYEAINSTFGNFKLIKFIKDSSVLTNRFKKASYGYAYSITKYQTLNSIPRIFLELVGFTLVISMVIYILYKYQKDITDVIPLLSIYVLALYRLMPSANRIMSTYNKILHESKALEIVYEELNFNEENLKKEKIEFSKQILIKNFSFKYGEKTIIDNISFYINKGDSVAFIGQSGSGKTTLVDNIIGLYNIKSGSIVIDGIELTDKNIASWRKKIGYIPQTVYLFDGTVAENIAFDNNFDEEKLVKVLKQAKIYDFLQEKEGINTRVGEGGIQLSGGQKQRIAIARALYSKPEILVLDEATSALDEAIEAEIMDEIYDLAKNKTLIIIAHRLSTIKRCDETFEIRNGKVINGKN
ncbi:MAG: ABC transporter ATP-binding protein [Campylobacterales bacterium]|nr:ABC transporter ATP-binding protein [Campylobacterales bacterium]